MQSLKHAKKVVSVFHIKTYAIVADKHRQRAVIRERQAALYSQLGDPGVLPDKDREGSLFIATAADIQPLDRLSTIKDAAAKAGQ